MSGTETSLFSLSSLSVKSYHYSIDNRKKLIYHLLQNPRELLVTIMMLNVFANIVIQNVVSSLFGIAAGWGVRVGVPLGLTLIFGEIIPKSIALPNNEKIAYKVAPFVATVARILGPFRKVLTKFTSYISRIFFFFLRKEEEISQDELEEALRGCINSKVLSKEESKLMEGYLDLHYTSVKELMRPREDVLFYNIHDPLHKLIHLFVDLQCTRIPVCDKDLENLLGVVSFREFFCKQEKIKSSHDVKKIVKKPHFIPESINAWTVLHDLREKKEDLAIVIDEYGSISGLLTQEDLIESVIGEIADLRDVKSLYSKSGEDVIIASGKLEISTLEEIFGRCLENKEKAVTIGGWLIEQLGDIPKTGTRYVTDDFLFYVLAAEPNRIKRVYIRHLKGREK